MMANEWLEKGIALGNTGKYEDALKAFKKAIDTDPQYAAAWYNKGVVLDILGKYKDALTAYEKATETDPQYVAAWYNKGVVFDNLGRYKDALAAYEKTLEIYPNHARALNNKGITLDNLKKYEDALKAFEKTIEIDPQYAAAWYNKGAVLFELKKYEDALKAFEKTIEIDPQHVGAWYNKGIALDNLKKYEDALKAFEKALEIDPTYMVAWYNKGGVLFELKKYEDALKAFEKYIETDPQHPGVWNNKGVVLFELEKYEDALKAFEKSIEVDPNDALAYANGGELFFILGDLKSASKKVEKALEINGEIPSALILKGRIEIEEKDYDSAINSFSEAICSDLGNPLPILWTGYAEYLKISSSIDTKDNEYQEGIVAIIRKLERAHELSRKRGSKEVRACILYFLGYFYFKSKDVFAAKASLEECVGLKSKSAIEKRACELLCNIWDYAIRPTWWRWWLSSPLNRRIKRGVFFFLLSSIFSLLLLHPFIPDLFSREVNWTLYVVPIALLIFFLLSPSIESIKTTEFEVELRSPPSFEPVLSPLRMEAKIGELEEE